MRLGVKAFAGLAPIEPPCLTLVPARILDLPPAGPRAVAVRRRPILEDDPFKPAVRHVEREAPSRVDDRGQLERDIEGLGEQFKAFAPRVPWQRAKVDTRQDRNIEHDEPEVGPVRFRLAAEADRDPGRRRMIAPEKFPGERAAAVAKIRKSGRYPSKPRIADVLGISERTLRNYDDRHSGTRQTNR
jgi:hypothetical protein